MSETLAGEVRELLGASEAAAHAIRERAVAEAEALREALRREAEETRGEAATRAQQEIASVVGESLKRLTAKAADVNGRLDELRSEANRFAAELAELGARMAPEADQPPPMIERERRARLIALTMAINGASRDETARYLEENCDLHDVDALVDSVYA
jgi:predicted RNase H-like nuclease (RuvC/YqgF family)